MSFAIVVFQYITACGLLTFVILAIAATVLEMTTRLRCRSAHRRKTKRSA